MTAIFSLLIVVLSTSARAQHSLDGVDDCTILASVVYTEVSRARLGHIGDAYRNLFYPDRNDAGICNQTARSTTGAFSSALRPAKLFVTWGLQTAHGGTFCPNQAFSRCYPTGDPGMPPWSTTDRLFVVLTWKAVYDAVSGQMAHYPGSDVSIFKANELRRSIRQSIAAANLDSVALDGPPLQGELR